MNVIPKITICMTTCPTCGSPISEDRNRGLVMNEINRLGAEWTICKSQKPSEVREWKLQKLEEELNALGAEVVEGWIRSK